MPSDDEEGGDHEVGEEAKEEWYQSELQGPLHEPATRLAHGFSAWSRSSTTTTMEQFVKHTIQRELGVRICKMVCKAHMMIGRKSKC